MNVKELFNYYSWHLEELLELYNVMAGTDFKDVALLHLELEEDSVCFWIQGKTAFYLPVK